MLSVPADDTAAIAAGPGRDGCAGSEDVVAMVARSQAGDTVAFASLYLIYHPEVAAHLRRCVGDELADDLASETFVRAWLGLRSFSWQGRSFAAWLITIAHNLARDHWKSSRSRREVLDAGLSERVVVDHRPESRPTDVVLARLEIAEVLRALDQLSATYRECLIARFVDELSLAETAAHLDKSVGAVKLTQHRAIKELRAQLAAPHHDLGPGWTTNPDSSVRGSPVD